MTTKTKPGSGSAKQVKEIFRGDVPIEKIHIVGNYRRQFDKKKLQELADNIGKVGVLEPILLRPNGKKDHFYLVAGERRLRAAKMAGEKTIPSRAFRIDENQAAEIQALENLHREDLGPIEEARAFKTLLRGTTYDTKSLAQRIDKSEAYVYRAIALLELPKSLQDLIAEKKITAAHGTQVLRLPAADRGKISKHDLLIQTAKYIGRIIDDRLGRDLSKATFPRDKIFAKRIACTSCPSNSGNQGMLFDGAVKGKCTGVKCYDAKQKAGRAAFAEKGWSKYSKIKSAGVIEGYNAKKPGVEIGDYSFDKAKVASATKKFPEKFVVVLRVFGPANISHEWMLCCVDSKLAKKLSARGYGGYSSSRSTSRPPARSPRDKAIEKALEERVPKEVAAAFKKSTTKDHIALIQKGWTTSYAGKQLKTFGIDAKKSMTPAAAVRAVAFLEVEWNSLNNDDVLEVLVGDPKKLRKAWKKEAEDKYDKAHPVAAKKARKRKK